MVTFSKSLSISFICSSSGDFNSLRVSLLAVPISEQWLRTGTLPSFSLGAISSQGRLQALQQLPFASLLLSSSGPQWWQLTWLLISSFPTPYWKSLHAVTETWPKDICIPYIFQFRRDHGPVPPDPLHTWAWNRPTPMSLWEQGCTLHYSLKRLIFKKGLGNLNREQCVI